MARKESNLLEKASLLEGITEECARYRAELEASKKQAEVLKEETLRLTDELGKAKEAEKRKSEEYEDAKLQVIAMEELTVSLTKQHQEKET